MKRNNLCEWNPLFQRPVFLENESGNCDNPIKWGVGFNKTQWILCEQCSQLPIFKRFQFKIEIQPKPQLLKDDFNF